VAAIDLPVYETFVKQALSILVAFLFATATHSAVSRHVVVVVWDGMRPDFLSETNTPILWKLSKRGVTFLNHRSVFPSATIVNGTALATGVYPGRSGIIANHVYRPEIDSKNSVDVEIPAVVRKGDQLSGGKYVASPTLAEMVQGGGGRTVIASAKTIGLLLDRQLDPARAKNCVTLFAGQTIPAEALDPIIGALGPFPPATAAAERDNWTTSALVDFLWRDDLPAFSLLWLSEPDDTEHRTAPGAPAALVALKTSDHNLGRVLAALDHHNARESTDIFVVSDHGFSTIEHMIELPKVLNSAGFNAVTRFIDEPKAGEIMIVGNGGSVLFYVMQQDTAVTHRLVDFLQQSDFAGVIFTKEKMEGTFALEQAKIDHPSAPDVVMAFRWNDSKNQFGVAGMIDGDWQRAAGKGTHATLSRLDMHNTLIAAGPDFRGEISNTPSGNLDLAPTILKILGIKSASTMDGRVLLEAMGGSPSQMAPPEPETVEAVHQFSSGTWRQTLKISRLGSTTYLDEGNGAFMSKEPGRK
jgi:arylsulfatase A-like enzyme